MTGAVQQPQLYNHHLIRAVTTQPIGWRALLLAVSLAVCAGVCRAAAQESSPANPATAEAHLGRGYDALKQDQYNVAATEFRAALAQDPALAERAQFPLAVALFEMHQPSEARREFDALRRQLGDHPNILYYLGRLDLEASDFKGAIQNLSHAAAKPPFPDTVYYLGFAFLKQHDLTDAEKWLKVAAQLIPQDSRVGYQLAKVYREQGREEEAKQVLAHSEELRQRDENDVRVKQECAQKLKQGLKEEARATCQQLYDPDNAERLTSLGTIYGQHGDLESALQCFQRAAEVAPQSPQMQYNLALTYYQLNQFAKARAPLERALERWSDLFQLNALYGAVLAKLGEDASAYQALRHAHELNPQDSGTTDLLYFTTLQLAQKAQQTREYPHSLRYLQEAANLRPDQAEPHRRMAEIYSLTAHAAQASAEQREADRLNKSSAN
jgi:tetratricopeptide (TPR) repeat protein